MQENPGDEVSWGSFEENFNERKSLEDFAKMLEPVIVVRIEGDKVLDDFKKNRTSSKNLYIELLVF